MVRKFLNNIQNKTENLIAQMSFRQFKEFSVISFVLAILQMLFNYLALFRLGIYYRKHFE